jgi:hypothetical protein
LVVRRVGNIDGGVTGSLLDGLGRGRVCAVEVAMKTCTGATGEREPLPQGEVRHVQTYSRPVRDTGGVTGTTPTDIDS